MRMGPSKVFSLAIAVLLVMASNAYSSEESRSIASYHGHSDRSGNFIVPALTYDRAHGLHADTAFHARFPGHVYG
jgi:hypothetical protein